MSRLADCSDSPKRTGTSTVPRSVKRKTRTRQLETSTGVCHLPLTSPFPSLQSQVPEMLTLWTASKTLAEKAFWKFIKEEKPSFDGATINPPLVFGPIIHQVKDIESLNTSVAIFSQWQKGEHKADELPAPAGNYVDVREGTFSYFNGPGRRHIHTTVSS